MKFRWRPRRIQVTELEGKQTKTLNSVLSVSKGSVYAPLGGEKMI